MITILDLDELLSWVAGSEPGRAKNLGAKADHGSADVPRADLARADLREADLGDEIRSGAREPLPG